MRILIAEDDEALGKFVRQGLEDEHYSEDIFKDREQAISDRDSFKIAPSR